MPNSGFWFSSKETGGKRKTGVSAASYALVADGATAASENPDGSLGRCCFGRCCLDTAAAIGFVARFTLKILGAYQMKRRSRPSVSLFSRRQFVVAGISGLAGGAALWERRAPAQD